MTTKKPTTEGQQKLTRRKGRQPKTKLPQARVMYVAASGRHLTGSTYRNYLSAEANGSIIKGCFIPTPSASKARQIVRAAPFLTMTGEEQVETLRKLLARNWTGSYEEDARAVLAAIRGGAK